MGTGKRIARGNGELKMASCSFDNNAKNLALLTPDGRLKVWECKSKTLRHEFTPSAHLVSTCTCLRWSRLGKIGDSPKKKHQKKNTKSAESNDGIIALGTETGSVLLFDTLIGEVSDKLDGGHESRVNDLCWKEDDTDLLYSCSDDGFIVEWSFTTTQIKCKWKGDKHGVKSIQVCSLGSFLLSAGRSIKLWDLDTKKVLKKFTGHATPITQLTFVPQILDANHNQNGEVAGIDGQYFLSAAESDRLINVWKVDLDNPDKNSLVSFSLTDEPVSLDLTRYQHKVKPIHLAVVSKDGQLHLYVQTLNGKGKKPISPTTTIQLSTPESKGVSPSPIPILGARFTQDREPAILICYGSTIKPQFETLSYESFERHVCLIRENQSSLLLGGNLSPHDKNKSRAVKPSKEVTTLGPASNVIPAPTISSDEPSRKKRKEKNVTDASSTSVEEPTMEDRLKTMDLTPAASERSEKQHKAPPTAGSLVQMLVQALHSEDNLLLEDVLRTSNKEAIMRNTVKKLPVKLVVPLLKELMNKFQASPARGPQLIAWIRMLMTFHMSYLMTVPDLVDTLGSLYQLLETRVAVFSKLCRLQGRLELLLSQVTAQSQHAVDEEELSQPLAVYEEEDSEEDLETISPSLLHSEESNDWEEGSEGEKSEEESEVDGQNDNDEDEEMESEEEG